MKPISAAVPLVSLVLGAPAALAAGDFGPVGSEFQVNTYSTSSQIEASAAAGPAGEMVVVWSDKSGVDDPAGYGIRGRRFNADGSDLGADFPVNSYATGNQRNPVVAVGAGGGFLVVWTDDSGQDGADRGIQGRAFGSDGQPAGIEFGINTYTTGQQLLPAVEFTDRLFTVVWEDRSGSDGSQAGIRGQRFSPVMRAASDFPVNEITSGPQTVPDVAGGANGEFTVVWQGYADGSGYSIQGRSFDSSGVGTGTEFTVNSYTFGFQTGPKIAAAPDGDFVVVWADGFPYFPGHDGSDSGIQGRRFSSDGTPLAPEFGVNTITSDIQLYADVGVTSAGDFLVAWSDTSGQDGNFTGVRAQHFDADGTALAGEFTVNTSTTGVQAYSAVAADPRGSFLVAWIDDEGLDGDGRSVQGQRYRTSDIFADDFDGTQNLCRWSSAVPDPCL